MMGQKRLHEMSKLKGFTVRKNKGGFAVISCHYTADPAKDLTWAEKTKSGYPESSWEREFEMNRDTQEGQRVYPGYDRNIHSGYSIEYNPYRPLYRGWDFGFTHPAIVWIQLNEFDQLCAIGELMGVDVPIEEFVNQVKAHEKKLFGHKKNDRTDFNIYDWGDPAGSQRSDKGGTSKSPQSTISVLRNKFGINVRTRRYEIMVGVDLIRSLFLERKDKKPGILIDPIECPLLCQGMQGGYVIEMDKSRDVPKEKPVKDGHYDHLQDAFRYLCTGIINPDRRKVRAQYTVSNPGKQDWDTYWERNTPPKLRKRGRFDRGGGGRSSTTGY